MSAKPITTLPSSSATIKPVHGVTVITRHALSRYVALTGCTATGDDLANRLRRLLRASVPAELHPSRVPVKLQNHGGAPAQYRMIGDYMVRNGNAFVFVICGETLVTFHRNLSGEWMPAALRA